ncbi:MAG: alpha/beta hydrolase [Chloroflexi bacterium]|nr:alpha/beta hydrolase [Chloroflexota bacterium]
MSTHPLDDPRILAGLFYPRSARANENLPPGARDGTVTIAADVVIGYRWFPLKPEAPVILFFHGNGEVAADYSTVAPLYHNIGVSLLVVDYRGYGWSTGFPLVSALLTDAEKIAAALPQILGDAPADKPVYVMGRSLGSAPAIHLAYTYPERFRGLIIDSGFAETPSLFKRLGIDTTGLNIDESPIGNARKIASIDLPLLIIHGERDLLLPLSNAQQLFDAAPSTQKRLLVIRGAGHNNLLVYGSGDYFLALAGFTQR